MQIAAPSPNHHQHPSHILLTVLGTNPRAATYALQGEVCEAPLAPLALLRLLPPEQQPDHVVALCTEEAGKDSLPILRDNLPDACTLSPVEVPSGYSQDDIHTFLSRATAAIPSAADKTIRISIDVTHGFRHFSFLAYLAGLYLVSLRNVELNGAWYGLLQPGESPFLDLRPLLKLPIWIHALQVLRDTGSALPLAEALEAEVTDRTAATIARELRLISEGYLSAIPLELGRQVEQFLSQRPKAMAKLIRNSHQLPLAAELVNRLEHQLRPFAIEPQPSRHGWKANLPLTREELQRQGHLIDSLFAHEDEAVALGLLNEWTVSWALWCLNDTSQWLDFYRHRRRAASQLGAIAAASKNPQLRALLSPEQKALGDFWQLLTKLRNGFHHHGMRPALMVGNPEINQELKRAKTYWQNTLQACPRLCLRLGDDSGGTVLVSPIGNRPGVLFSALMACRERMGHQPAACLVICSRQSADAIQEAAMRANFSGSIIRLVLEDPHGGLQEFARLREEAQRTCLRANDVLVNVTGGTTLMGLAAQELEHLAQSFARPVQRFGLIDRRTPKEQEADPYQPGEPFWLQESRG